MAVTAKKIVHKVKRLDEKPRIIFIGEVRLDPKSTIVSDESMKELQKAKAFKEYKTAGLIEVTAIDISDEEAVKSALAEVESIQARRNADELLSGLGYGEAQGDE